LNFLKGRSVPLALQDSLNQPGEYLGMAPQKIESSKDIMHMFARTHRVGLLGCMATPGEFFTDGNPETRIRIATVDRSLEKLREVANTIKGVIGMVMGLDLNKLGVQTRPVEELRQKFPPTQDAGFDMHAVLDDPAGTLKKSAKLGTPSL
jgi:hypothetical protein